MENKSIKIIKRLKPNKVLKKETVDNIVGNSRSVCGIMQSLEKRGYNIETIRDDGGFYITGYRLIEYRKPLHLIIRDIKINYPELEVKIRKMYNQVKK